MAYSDTFIEQLVIIKNSTKIKAVKIAIWTVSSLLSLGFIGFAVLYRILAFILLLLAALVLFLSYHLCGQLNNEFEYIMTNRDIDIDRIVNKKKRIRMASFTVGDIENIEKYNPQKHIANKNSNVNVYFGCTPDDSSYAFTIRHPKKGSYILVISPNEDFKNALRKSVTYNLKRNI